MLKKWNWDLCMIMKHMGPRIIYDDAFSSALRKAWPLHPETVVQGLGNSWFIVEFKEQEDMFKVMARSTWMCQKDMVVTRVAAGPEDLTNSKIEEFDCWVEVHGIPKESVDDDGLKLIMRDIGAPLTEIKSFFYADQRVYKQRVTIKLKDPLKPKLPLRHPQLGRQWVCVVYDNIANVCMFCARIGHSNMVCPAKLKLKLMKKQETHKEQLDDKPIPDTVVGKWLMDRAYVPRQKAATIPREAGESSATTATDRNKTKPGREGAAKMDRGLKRPMSLNISEHGLLTVGGDSGKDEGEEVAHRHLNCKRAKEAIPNSPSRFA